MASGLALAGWAVFVAAGAAAVWRRPLRALYLLALLLPLHNIVMSLLWGAGVRGGAQEVVASWKEAVLAVALAAVALPAARERRLPFRPGLVDVLALSFAAIVVLYAVIPQSALGGEAGARAVLYGLRHGLVPVAAYLLGRSLALGAPELRRLGAAILAAAAAVAVFGLVEEYTVSVEWWRSSGTVGYFRDGLGFDYHGPGGMPENFAFNTADGVFRRLISTFVSPLATGYLLVVALLLLTALRGRRRLVLGLVALAGLLFTFSRSSALGLAVGLVVVALASRRPWPVAAAVAVVAASFGFAAAYPSIAPRTHWFPSDVPYQEAVAKEKGPLPESSGLDGTYSLAEPSIRSHLDALRDGLRTVVEHPQGFGLGNAGSTASRTGTEVKAGESNYTETGVETGLLGMLLLIAWNLALLAGLIRRARAATGADRAVAAAVAGALAAVLAIATQTDAYGVPWLAVTLWWLAGATVRPAPLRLPRGAPAPFSRDPTRAGSRLPETTP